VLNDDQWQAATRLFVQIVPQFFPDNSIVPSFVPLHDSVRLLLNELQQDLPPADAGAPAIHAPPPDKRARVDIPHPAAASAASSSPSHSSRSAVDMDGEQKPDEDKEGQDKEHDLNWELERWFSPAHGAVFMLWDDAQSEPSVQWRKLDNTFPRLAYLARRFLCVIPTSAPSERVWSGFGHVIDKCSSSIDSSLAAKIMFLRYNQHLLEAIPFS
jgi:hypothetical protein